MVKCSSIGFFQVVSDLSEIPDEQKQHMLYTPNAELETRNMFLPGE